MSAHHISRQFRHKLTRAIVADPVLAESLKAHRRIVKNGHCWPAAFWHHYTVERAARLNRRGSLWLALKWMEQEAGN